MGQVIVEDTRQQVARGDKHANKHAWWDAHGVTWRREKLPFGDYVTSDGSSNRSIDTKRSLSEVAQNVGRDHARFCRECDRAREAGYRLVVLIEVGPPYRQLDDVALWVNDACKRCQRRRAGECDPRLCVRCREYRAKPMQGAVLLRIMRGIERDHGCRFELCRPSRSALRICEILGVRYEK